MSPFWHFARTLLNYRGTLIAALVFAALAGMSLGVGLLGLVPVLNVVLKDGAKSLPQLAEEYNAERIADAIAKDKPEPALLIPDRVIAALPDDPFQGVAMIVVGLILLTIFGATCNFLHQYFSATVSIRAVAHIREQTFRKVIDFPLLTVVQRGPSQLVARIVRDTAELRSGFLALTNKTVAQIVKGMGGFIAALVLHPGLTLLAIIVLPALGIIFRKIGKRIRRGTRGALQAQAELLHIASESLQGLRAVKANVGESRINARFSGTNRKVIRNELRVRTAKAFASPLVEVISVVVIGGLALIAVYWILQGDLSAERFMVALAALAVAGASFRPLAGLYNELQAASAPARRLLDVLEEDTEEQSGAALPDLPRHQRSLEFLNVTLTYPGADQPAVNDITLRIAHGERIAIVGPNGSGKTTLLSLVPRLLTPESGAILLDGVDISSVSLRSVREQVGVVTQETVLFHASVAENIAFGVAPEEAARDRIIDAAKQAHAHEFIMQIPSGYDADVLEQGSSLSGGQRQRIAIARAIMRDPSILILDEATSQIDAESEAHINDALKKFCKGRTSLIIAHRLSTVLNADRIVVMDRGRIVDQGTHAQLLSRCDLYARLNHTQLAGA